MKKVIFTLLLLGFAATAAQADDKFTQMDTNKDGKVSKEEFKATYPQMKEHVFDLIDTDKDGYLSHEEWHKFLEQHQMGMKQGGGMGGGGMPPASEGHPGNSPMLITPPPSGR